jgi:hypothetical protein
MPPIYDYSYYTLRQPPDSQELVNATIEGHSSLHPTVFHLNTGPKRCLPPPSTDAQQAPSPFRRYVRQFVNPDSLHLLQQAVAKKTLTITTGGSYNPMTSRASFKWIMDGPHTIIKASRPISAKDCNAYRAELHGILAALTTLHIMEEEFPNSTGTATLYTDCQQALKNSLSSGPIGIKDATQDEYDLILEIRQLRNTLRTKIQPLWTPGHPSKEDPRGEQVKNAKAHALAVRQLHSTDPG